MTPEATPKTLEGLLEDVKQRHKELERIFKKAKEENEQYRKRLQENIDRTKNPKKYMKKEIALILAKQETGIDIKEDVDKLLENNHYHKSYLSKIYTPLLGENSKTEGFVWINEEPTYFKTKTEKEFNELEDTIRISTDPEHTCMKLGTHTVLATGAVISMIPLAYAISPTLAMQITQGNLLLPLLPYTALFIAGLGLLVHSKNRKIQETVSKLTKNQVYQKFEELGVAYTLGYQDSLNALAQE